MASPSLTDTSSWLPLDGLAPGFDQNKAPHSTDLAGRTLTLVTDDGTRITHEFDANDVTWTYVPGGGDGRAEQSDTDRYEAFVVDDDLYFLQFHHRSNQAEAVSLTLDLRSGRAVSVIANIRDVGDVAPGETRVSHDVVPATIEELDTTGPEPSPSNDLIGRRVQWVYSDTHAYEHTYLTPTWYTWQCLAGPERGLADTDEQSTWQIRPGIYIFAWREKVIPCASVTIADHRNPAAMRSHGVLFGLSEDLSSVTHFTFGSYGHLASVTEYAHDLDPRRQA